MTNYKNNEVLVGVTESVFSESDGTYYAFSSGFYIGKYDGKLVFTTKISDLQNINIWYNITYLPFITIIPLDLYPNFP